MDISILLLLLISYFIGSISPAYFIAKYRYNFDIRTRGSKNPGTTNALRTMGARPGLVVLILDIIKGAIPAMIGKQMYGIDMAGIYGFSAVMGHIYPFYLNFKGGKGVAASIGAVSVVLPKLALVIVLISTTLIYITKMVSVGSITGFMLLVIYCVYQMIVGDITVYYVLFSIMGLMGIISHRENIVRIIRNEENKLV